MKLHRLELTDFRGISSAEITLATDGLTIVEGPNEAGKSSLTDALDMLLELKDSSRAQAIRDAQPVDRDVAPIITAEISVGRTRFVYTKQFLRGKRTELSILAPRREQLRGDEAHDRVNAIFDAHVDTHLWKALRMVQDETIRQVPLAEHNALSAALDAAGGSSTKTSAEHETLYDAAFAETQRYFTPTFKTGRDRARLGEDCDEIGAQLAELEAQRRALDDDVARMQRIEEDLAALRDDLPGLKRDAAALSRDADRARARAAERDAQRQAIDTTRREIEQLTALVRQRERRETERDELATRLAGIDEQLAVAQSGAESQGAKLDAARRAVAEHDALVAETQANAKRLSERVMRAGQAERLAALETRRRDLRALEDSLATTKTALAGIRVTGDDVDALVVLEHELGAVNAQLAAAAPQVSVSARRDLLLRRDGHDDTAVPRGNTVTLRLQDESPLEIVDVAGLAVTAGASDLVAERKTLAGRLDAQLKRLGVDSLPAAREALVARQRHEAMLDRLSGDIARLLGGDDRESLNAQVEKLRALVDSDTTPDDQPTADELDAAADAVEKAVAERDEARSALEHESRRSERLQSELRDLSTRRAVLGEQLERLRLEIADASSPGGDDTRPDDAEQLAAARERLTALERNLRANGDDSDAIDLAAIDTRRAAADAAVTSTRERIAVLDRELAALEATVGLRAEAGLYEKIVDAKSRHEALERQLAAMDRRAEAARRLYDALTDARQAQRAAYIAPMKHELEQLGRVVYGDGFSIELDDALRIVRRTLDGQILDYAQLSTGAREQLAVLVRLAVARLVDPKDGVPVILDDVLGHSDPERLRAMNAVLAAAGDRCQVIVLTCYPERYRHAARAKTVVIGGSV